MRLAVSALALAALLSSCAKEPADEGAGGSGAGKGGAPSKGGTSGSGGKTGTGGKSGTGGTAGSSTTTPPGQCKDVGSLSTTISGQYDRAIIAVDGNPNKTYIFQANWWHRFNQLSQVINGLSFTFRNPSNDAVPSGDNLPMGFPSLYIGAYGGDRYTSKGSNLPKAVSSLTSIPTVLSTNASSIGTSNYNATYDVWFTKTSSPVTGSSPGPGGAYLMVWLFQPSDRQPRGQPAATGLAVEGDKGVWNVWYDPSTDQMPCVSYVSLTPLSSWEFDLNVFIKDAVKHNWGVTSSQYLSIIFAGFEVWGGANGLELQKFCANVQ